MKGDPAADWDRDGRFMINDVVRFLPDIREGMCN